MSELRLQGACDSEGQRGRSGMRTDSPERRPRQMRPGDGGARGDRSRERFPAWASGTRGKKEGKSLKCFSTSHFLENPSRVAAAGSSLWCLRKQGSGWEGQAEPRAQATWPAPNPACQDITVPGLTGLWLQAILGPLGSSVQLCLASRPHGAALPPPTEGPSVMVT